MHYIKVITNSLVSYLCHYDSDKDAPLLDKLIDKGYKLEKAEPSDSSNHISAMFSDTIRTGL